MKDVSEWKEDPVEEHYRGNQDLYEKISDEIEGTFHPPKYYLDKIDATVKVKDKKTSFQPNKNEPVHRWSPYLEGFSSDFVKSMIKRFDLKDGEDKIFDPFAGSGTTNVTAKMLDYDNVGVEINPLSHFILSTKLNWSISPEEVEKEFEKLELPDSPSISAPEFLKTERQFQDDVLENILRLKEAIWDLENEEVQDHFKLAFATVLLPTSNLKRSPSLGYTDNDIDAKKPIDLFNDKIKHIIKDLEKVNRSKDHPDTDTHLGDAGKIQIEENSVDAVITSPPYLNFFDYPGNYKLELGWMDFAESTTDLKELRDSMVTCDNISRESVKKYEEEGRKWSHPWLEEIIEEFEKRIENRPDIRRSDYDIIAGKYFDDMYSVMENVSKSMKPGAKMAYVVGDSLIQDVYVPTDLILAKQAEDLGLEIEEIIIGRKRYSGIRRSFVLRETTTILRKK